MDGKQIRLTFLIMVVGMGGVASAADDFVWTNNYATNSSWCEGDNWDQTTVPGSSDTAIIRETSPDRGPIVGIGCNVDVTAITGPEPDFGHTQVIDINTGGTVRVRGGWVWRKEEGSAGTGIININGSPAITIGDTWRGLDDGVSIVNIEGSPSITVGGDMRGADGSGWFYVNMSGGYLEVNNYIMWGDNGGGSLTMSGGSILCDYLGLGGDRGSAPITIDMNEPGGLITVREAFYFPSNGSRAGAVRTNLRAGVIACKEFVHGGQNPENPTWTDDWRVDIEQGMLKINGDKTTAIDANVANGQITAYDGEGTVVVEFIDGNTVVTALPPDPNTATNPIPPNRSEGQDPNVDLGWTSGINAAQHKIFFGTGFDDVNDMTDPCDTKDRGDETYEPNTLELDTTYYWRIDEVNGPRTWRGRVWYFTTKSPIDDPNLLVHYKLDETSGFAARDSSGHGNHGAVDGPESGWDPNDAHPHDGGCRNFTSPDGDDPVTVIECPSAALNTVDKSVTVSVWLKDAYNIDDLDNWVFHCGAGGEAGPYQVGAVVVTENIRPAGQVLWRAGNDSNDLLMWDLDGRNAASLEGWHHWAFVKHENAGVMRIYFDGIMVEDKSGTLNTLGFVQDAVLKIGTASWANYNYMGKMDDFKLYDRALTDKEIEELYRGGDVGYPWAPSPGDYAEDVPRDANLSWRPGNYVVEHEVFFGTDWDDVNDMTEPCSVQDACEYEPGTLKLDTTYYWRIDEVNDPCVWKGPVWRFTVGDFIILDDFESYDKSNNLIWYTWYCKQAMPYGQRSGAILSVSASIVHTDDQAMKYSYETDDSKYWDQDYAYSDACLPLEEIGGFQDWTTVDVRLLTIFFYGQAQNDANETEQMYMGVRDTFNRYAEMRYGDNEGQLLSDLKAEEWHRWDVPFVWFADGNFAAVSADIDFSSISSVYLGFGDKSNPVRAGNGTVYFDDLRLGLPICKPEYGPQADFSGDCIVDIADVGKMGEQWLRSDVNFADDLGIVVQEPCDANLVGHYKLDEGTGTFAEDSSANHYHGTLEITNEGGYSWATGHIGAGAVEFSGGRVRVDDDGNAPSLRPLHEVGVSAWIYIRREMSSARCVVKGKNDYETYEIELDGYDHFVFCVRDPCGTRYALDDSYVWPYEWVHVAGTYDGNALTSYVNGQIEETKDVNNPTGILSQDLTGFAIGNKPDGDANDTPFEGTIDDVRVYDYALSQAEVAWLATEGTGEFFITTPANLYSGEDPEVINFKDFARLMDSWLDEQLWPPL